MNEARLKLVVLWFYFASLVVSDNETVVKRFTTPSGTSCVYERFRTALFCRWTHVYAASAARTVTKTPSIQGGFS